MVAVIRPDAWELPLFLHVAGAMLLVGHVQEQRELPCVGADHGDHHVTPRA